MPWTGRVKVGTMMEAICAIHLSSYVDSPYRDRGGLMIVGPPGVLKTTLLDVLDDNFHNALSISNAYMGTMKKLQPAFYNGQVRSLCFPDIQSIYAGDPRTSSRIEQMMMQLSGEATRTIGGDEDSRHAKFKGFCTMFGAMTDFFYTGHVGRWDTTGFLRRFLWSTYTLRDPDILMRAIEQWTRAELGYRVVPQIPMGGRIPDSLTQAERKEIWSWLRHQPLPHEIQLQVLCKAVSALKWHYEQVGLKRSAMATMHEFAETLQKDAALLEFPEQQYDREVPSKKLPPKRKRTASHHLRARRNRATLRNSSPTNHSTKPDDRAQVAAPELRPREKIDEHGTLGNLETVPAKQN